MDCSLPGSSVHGILQARILEWVAIPCSRGSSQTMDRIQVSCTVGWFFTSEPSEKPGMIKIENQGRESTPRNVSLAGSSARLTSLSRKLRVGTQLLYLLRGLERALASKLSFKFWLHHFLALWSGQVTYHLTISGVTAAVKLTPHETVRVTLRDVWDINRWKCLLDSRHAHSLSLPLLCSHTDIVYIWRRNKYRWTVEWSFLLVWV